MAGTLTVRPAREEDAYALWIWANDPGTRAASFGRPQIPWSEHRAWLARTLADPRRVTLIAAAEEDQPVGSIRFDTEDDWRTARLSYVIAPEMRGQRLSAPLVFAGLGWIRTLRPGAAIWARVMDANLRSLRVFRGLGWREEPDGSGGVRFWSPTEKS